MSLQLYRDFKSILSVPARTCRQKNQQRYRILEQCYQPLDLGYMWNLTQGTEVYTFSLSTYGLFTKADLVVGHRTSLNKFRRTEVIQSMFSNHNIIRNKIRQISFCKERKKFTSYLTLYTKMNSNGSQI